MKVSASTWRLATNEVVRPVESNAAGRARQAAIDAAQWSLDLGLQYGPQAEIDLARFDLWAAQLTLDAAAGDTNAVRGDVFTVGYIRDRIMNSLDAAATRVNTAFMDLQVAAGEEGFAAASDAAEQLRDTLGRLEN